MNPMFHLIPPDTPTPLRVDTLLLIAAIYNLCSHMIHHTPQHICALAEETLLCNAVSNPNTSQSLQYKQLVKGPEKVLWGQSFVNEFGRLAHGAGNRIKGTNTVFFNLSQSYHSNHQKQSTTKVCMTLNHAKMKLTAQA